jgi:hypothetical protein
VDWQSLLRDSTRKTTTSACTLGCGASGIYCIRNMALRPFSLVGLDRVMN